MNASNKNRVEDNPFIKSYWFVVLLGALTAFDPLSIDMYLPAFQKIQSDLHTTYSYVELSLSSFFIGMSLGQLFYGPVADRFGRKKPLLFGMFIYMLSTFLCGTATNIYFLIAFRILQAFGGCAGMVITRAIIRDVFGPTKMASFLSSMSLIMGIAPILAPTIGGAIIQVTSWRAIFYLLAGLNLICFFSIMFFLPETHFNRSGEIKIKSTISTYFDLLKDRHFIGYTIPDSFIRAAMFGYIAGSPFVFMEIYHIPSSQYGKIFGANAFGLILATQINKFLLKKYDPEIILKKTRPVTMMAAFLLLVMPMIFNSVFALMIPLFCFILTLGFVGANSGAIALTHQGHRAGMASAMYGTIQWGTAILTSFLVSYFHNGTMYPMTIVIFACALISLIGFYFLVVRHKEISRAKKLAL